MGTTKRIPENRPLTSDEKQLASHLLQNCGSPDAMAFLPQLEHVLVTGRCPCGCPTIDLNVPREFRILNPPAQRLIADAFGHVGNKVVGVMILQDDGLLSLFEAYRLENVDDDQFGFPAIETVSKAEWTERLSSRQPRMSSNQLQPFFHGVDATLELGIFGQLQHLFEARSGLVSSGDEVAAVDEQLRADCFFG
jgi:hypothetical protein